MFLDGETITQDLSHKFQKFISLYEPIPKIQFSHKFQWLVPLDVSLMNKFDRRKFHLIKLELSYWLN